MSKLLSFFSLCPINNLNEFLGLSKDAEAGSVINTIGKNIVLISKLHNQKQIKSWTVLDRLTSKVIYDFTRKQYVGVFGNRNLRFWDENDLDINKIKKVKLHRNVHDLYNVDTNGEKCVLVVYKNGTCESLEMALESKKEAKETANHMENLSFTIENVKVIVLPNDSSVLLLTYFKMYPKKNLVELNFVTVDRETLQVTQNFKTIDISRVDQNVELCGSIVIESSGRYPTLLSIWNDKRVFTQTLKYDDKSITKDTLGSLISMIDVINVKQPISLDSINKDCIAIYGANKNEDGAFVLLYNVKFKVVQSKQYFKIYFRESRMWIIDNNILLAFGKTLSVIPFRVSDEMLSDMVGSQRNSGVLGLVEKELLNEDMEKEEAVKFNEQQNDTFDATVEDDEGILSTYTYRKKQAKQFSGSKFEDTLNAEIQLKTLYREDLLVDLIRDENQAPGTVELNLFSKVDDGFLKLSEQFELLSIDLERHGASEMEITNILLPVLIKANRTTDIGKVLKKYNHVSEKVLVQTLKYLVNCPVQVEEDQNGANDSTESSREDVLNILLSCSFDSKSIVKFLRTEINLNELIFLMDYMQKLIAKSPLDGPDLVDDITPNSVNIDEFDYDGQLFEWFTLLLDSHYQQILMTKDQKLCKKLIEWRNLVDKFMLTLNSMISLRPTLLNVVNNKTMGPRIKSNKWYSIEEIKLY